MQLFRRGLPGRAFGGVPLEQVAIPLPEHSPCFIRALQEGEQCFLRRGLTAYVIVEINEFTQGFVVAGLCGLDGCSFKALGRRGGVAVESRLAEAPIARPEAGTYDLVRVRLPRHSIGAFARRSGSARESRNREVEASPEEVNWADLANKARRKFLKDFIRVHQHSPELMRRVRVIGRVFGILGEGNRVLKFYRHRVNVYVDAECSKAALIFGVETSHRLRAQRSRQGGPRAHQKSELMAHEIKSDLEKL